MTRRRCLAYVGIGANLTVGGIGPAERVRITFEWLEKLGRVRASSLYRTEPLGDPDQPWFVNAVAELRTGLSPEKLLRGLQALERDAGRPLERERWTPRELDLDILLYGDRQITSPALEIPHPAFASRRFVLEPLAELAPHATDPRTGKSVAELLRALDDPLGVEKIPGSCPVP